MRPSPEIRYDVASAISQGQRSYQEDAIITDFPLGSEVGFAVLADGMGGHAAGDVASKIVVTEVFSELKLQSGDQFSFEENVCDILLDAALSANECVNGHVNRNPDTAGMGATLVAPVFVRDNLSWISIGDSPLYLYRKGILKQLNEDHSMAPQIDLMVASGMLGAEAGANHPDRNCLTSVLIGDEIPRIDCPKTPIKLHDGDLLVVASDGLQFLSNTQIENALADCSHLSSREISEVLLRTLEKLADPDQDNISFSVIKFKRTSRNENIAQLHVTPDEQAQIAFSSGRKRDGNIAARRHAVVRPINLFRDMPDAADGSR
ncbi:MAG: PP2C family protein-serine/threonine phosphatase [Paracoccaceae bacterium]